MSRPSSRMLQMQQGGMNVEQLAQLQRLRGRFYVYQATIAAVASGADGSDQVQIATDHDFRVEALVGATYVNNALVASPYATVQISDGGSDVSWFNEEVPLPMVFGDAKQPMILPTPYVIAAGSLVTVNVSNVNSAAAATFYLAFLGAKVRRAQV